MQKVFSLLKVEESLESLRSILMKKNAEKNTKNTLLLKSDVYYLLSSLKLLPISNEDLSIDTEGKLINYMQG